MATNEITDQLNLLLKRNYDAEKGYKQAYENARHDSLKAFFENNYKERYRFGHDIKDILRDMDAEPDKGSTPEADAHRVWMDIKEKLALNDDKAILEECERGEKYALNDYRELLDTDDLQPRFKEILSEHFHSIKNSLEQVQKLEKIV